MCIDLERFLKSHGIYALLGMKGLKKQPDDRTTKTCNCRNDCPLPANNECRSDCVIYKATVNSESTTKTYIGSTETDIKLRIANHSYSFRNAKLRNATRLSAYVHELQESNKPYNISWNIESKSYPYQCGSRRCNLCITEKLEILRRDPSKLLNARTEIANKCRHSTKFKLRNVK